MAIQIDEKLLSPVAREALRNAKSKSKLLRDALEAYVRMDISNMVSNNDSTYGQEILDSVKEIKEMLRGLSDNRTLPKKIKATKLETNTIQEVAATEEIEHENSDLISEEEKKRIESLYDSSLIGFGEGDF